MKKKLLEYASFIRGVTYAGGESTPTRKDGTAPILRAGNIGSELKLEEDLAWVPVTRISEDQWLQPNDLAMCLSSGSPLHVGKTARLSVNWKGSVGGFCGIVRPKESVDASYLGSWLRSDEFFKWRDSQSRGSNIQNLQFGELAGFEVDFPPLPEQKRLAAALDRRLALIAEAREAAERRLAAAELLESALFREVFGGVTPVSIGYGEGVFNPFAQAKPLPKSSAKGLQTPSPYRRLSEVARLESGHTPSRKRPEWWGGDIPWIALPDIRALDGRIAMETIRNTNPKGIANSSARILPKDTVMLSRTASVGFVSIMGRPMATSQDFFNWICGDGLNPRYLMHALRASKPYLESMSSGAIHKTIYMPAARDFHLLLPPRETQDAIAADLDTRLAEAAAILQSARTALETIKALPAAALREVFG